MEYEILQKKLDHMFSKLGSIEKKIHISWKNKDVINKNFNIIKHGILKLKLLNPDYEFKIYDDDDIEQYLKLKLSEEDYNLIKNRKIVEKTDLWRLLIIYDEGGLYQDIDRLCNIPLSSIIKPTTKCFLPTYFDVDTSQDIICTSKGNEIIKKAIEKNIERRKQGTTDIFYLGPITYFNTVTEIILGIELNREPEKDKIDLLRKLLNNSQYIETYREEPPYNTILYQGPPILFDKDPLYNCYNVSHWGS